MNPLSLCSESLRASVRSCPVWVNWRFPAQTSADESMMGGKVSPQPSKENTMGMWMCTVAHHELEQ